MKLDFKGWRIGFIFGIFLYGNGEGHETCQYLNSTISLISSLIGYIFKKNNTTKKEVDKFMLFYRNYLQKRL
jgi:hypothetical protein